MIRIVVLGGGFAGIEAVAIRDIRGFRRRFRFRRDRVLGIDLAGRRVRLADGEIPWDKLVIALGGVRPSFGTPGVAEHAVTYKTLEDAATPPDLA